MAAAHPQQNRCPHESTTGCDNRSRQTGHEKSSSSSLSFSSFVPWLWWPPQLLPQPLPPCSPSSPHETPPIAASATATSAAVATAASLVEEKKRVDDRALRASGRGAEGEDADRTGDEEEEKEEEKAPPPLPPPFDAASASASASRLSLFLTALSTAM